MQGIVAQVTMAKCYRPAGLYVTEISYCPGGLNEYEMLLQALIIRH